MLNILAISKNVETPSGGGIPVGTIMSFATTAIPTSFLRCNGQTENIASYTDLFAVIGTTYGGDGITTFGIPNLNDKLAKGDNGSNLGDTGGSNILTEAQLPEHNHRLVGTDDMGDAGVFLGSYLSSSTGAGIPTTVTAPTQLFNANADSISLTGSDQPHEHPYTTVRYAICFEDVGAGGTAPTPSLDQVLVVGNNSTTRAQFNGDDYLTINDITPAINDDDNVVFVKTLGSNIGPSFSRPYVYNNGTAGVGATITGTTNVAWPTIGGATMVVGDIIAISSQTPASVNGVYVVNSVGSPTTTFQATRATNYDETAEVYPSVIIVQSGGNQNRIYRQTTVSPTIGTSNIVFNLIGQASVLPASQTEANAGVITNRYISPSTNNPNNYPATTELPDQNNDYFAFWNASMARIEKMNIQTFIESANVLDITSEEMKTLYNTGTFIPLMYYRVTDFQELYALNVLGTVMTGPVRTILVRAISSTQLEDYGYILETGEKCRYSISENQVIDGQSTGVDFESTIGGVITNDYGAGYSPPTTTNSPVVDNVVTFTAPATVETNSEDNNLYIENLTTGEYRDTGYKFIDQMVTDGELTISNVGLDYTATVGANLYSYYTPQNPIYAIGLWNNIGDTYVFSGVEGEMIDTVTRVFDSTSSVLLVDGVDYTYNSLTKTLTFLTAPIAGPADVEIDYRVGQRNNIGDIITLNIGVGNIYRFLYTVFDATNFVTLTDGVDYTFNSITGEITFLTAPVSGPANIYVNVEIGRPGTLIDFDNGDNRYFYLGYEVNSTVAKGTLKAIWKDDVGFYMPYNYRDIAVAVRFGTRPGFGTGFETGYLLLNPSTYSFGTAGYNTTETVEITWDGDINNYEIKYLTPYATDNSYQMQQTFIKNNGNEGSTINVVTNGGLFVQSYGRINNVVLNSLSSSVGTWYGDLNGAYGDALTIEEIGPGAEVINILAAYGRSGLKFAPGSSVSNISFNRFGNDWFFSGRIDRAFWKRQGSGSANWNNVRIHGGEYPFSTASLFFNFDKFGWFTLDSRMGKTSNMTLKNTVSTETAMDINLVVLPDQYGIENFRREGTTNLHLCENNWGTIRRLRNTNITGGSRSGNQFSNSGYDTCTFSGNVTGNTYQDVLISSKTQVHTNSTVNTQDTNANTYGHWRPVSGVATYTAVVST